MILRRTTFDAIHASGLTAEYALECAMDGMPAPDMQIDAYNAMDAVGAIYPLGAYVDDALIGFITILSPVLPHYGVRVAVVESYFVAKEYRITGAGKALREWVEDYAKGLGCAGVLMSAPHGGDLEKVLPRCGYRESNRVFFKGVYDSVTQLVEYLPSKQNVAGSTPAAISNLQKKVKNLHKIISDLKDKQVVYKGQIASFGTSYAELHSLRRIVAKIPDDDLRKENERLREKINTLREISEQFIRLSLSDK